ncbi:MAG: beta-ketoacyl-[acyl-carrier-protein] synthase family protein [Bacteroidales bacterium]|nr:beta-ketoacyl-[acyl-carrier-protein] synthase family protein [Bacteroidales bacterium]MDD4604483.1 beta-ketoacyl-[acyl-carrier-protein] synthase family protein [Bacteroidales bacterium]
MAREVVITGMSLITSLGLTIEENWKSIINGKSGVKRITLFDPTNCATQIAAQVPDEFEALSKIWIKKRAASQMTRVTRMCMTAAKMAVANSGMNFDDTDRSKCGVIMGVVNTGNSSVEKNTTTQNTVFKSMTNAMPAWLSMEYQLTGPNFAVNTACASSAYAISLGYQMIKSGQSDVMIVGGADSIINPEEIRGFNALYALSVANDPPEQASKPFSKDRDGFVIGEGAGTIILESKEHALARKAHIHCEMAGCSITSEGYNIMAPMNDGEGMAFSIRKALENSGIQKEEVGYINAHGTSTELNDRFETMAIKKEFGELAYHIPISSSKSMLGHTIGAAGAIEAIITILALENGILPPTINYRIPDPDLDLDYIPNQSRKKEINVALSNSFGFGGHNAIIVLKK